MKNCGFEITRDGTSFGALPPRGLGQAIASTGWNGDQAFTTLPIIDASLGIL
jgi:hypothetical protein